jgi:type I restriction enzyme S subunit
MKTIEQKAKKVPAIRFAGFEDELVNKIFRESFTYLQNNTLSRAELNSESGLAKNIHYGDVLVKFGECIDVAEEKIPFVSDAFVIDKFKNSFLQDGDIVIADTAEDETVGKCTEMQGVNDAILLSGLHTIPSRPKEKYGSKFLGYYLNSSAYRQQLLPLMQGVKVLSISKSALQETNLVIPKDNQEQQKIGSFFSNIDSLISLEQKKYDKLTQVKKSMLEKMFPKEGATVPEIRFAGFTGSWERKKLGKISNIVTGTLDANAAQKDGLYSFFTCGKEVLKTNSYAFEGNAILINGNGDLGFTRKFSGKFNAYQRTYVLQNFAVDFEYVEHCIHRYLPNRIVNESFGGAMPYIKLNTLSDLLLPIPSEKEMKCISLYLNDIDSLISLQQRKLEKLKNIKKSLLEKMFV